MSDFWAQFKQVNPQKEKNDSDDYWGKFEEFSDNSQSWDNVAVGATSAYARGGSLGLANKVGGIVNAIGAAPVDAMLTDKSFLQSFKDRYSEIADNSEIQRKKFAINHPYVNFALETGGNVQGAGKAIYNTLAKTGLKGIKLLSSAAGVEGTILGAADSEEMEDIPGNALVGGVSAASLAPIIPGGVKAGKWMGGVLAPKLGASKRAATKLAENIGTENLRHMVYNAQLHGSNVMATGDHKILNMAQAARQQTPEAADLIVDRLTDMSESRPEATRRIINSAFGKGNKYDNIDDLVDYAKTQAAPLYDELRGLGDMDAYALGKRASKELGGRLTTKKFSNIEFGRMNPDKLAQLNIIRAGNGFEPLKPDMKIPLNVVQKLYEKRVVNDKMKPSEVADMVFDVFVNPNNIVYASKYPHIQAVISPKEGVSNIGFISQNPENGETVIKSAYRKGNDVLREKYKKFSDTLDGRGVPSSVRIENPVAAPLSDLQGITNSDNISSLGKFVKESDLIQSQIKKIRKNPEFSREMRSSADTDFSVLDQVNQNLGEMIEDAKRAGHMPTVMRLTMAKNEMLKQMDKIDKRYKEARNLYEAKGKAIRAQSIGEDVFKPDVSPDLMARKIKDMGYLEKKSLKIGVTAELLRKLGQSQNEAVALGRMLNDNTVNKLEIAYGKSIVKFFREYAQSEVKRNRNFNKILSGSQTSEKQSLKSTANLGLNILRNPTGVVGEIVGAAENRVSTETNKAIAELLTSPQGEALLKELNKQSKNKINKNIADILARANVAASVNLDKQ